MRRHYAALLALSFVLPALSCGAVRRPDGGAGLLPPGSPVPDLSATDQSGRLRRLADERGHPLVVYFYPKDGTPGCTREACAFRDAWQSYQRAQVQIFGISADDQKSHEGFAKEQHLPFPILADPSHTWSSAFGVSTVAGLDLTSQLSRRCRRESRAGLPQRRPWGPRGRASQGRGVPRPHGTIAFHFGRVRSPDGVAGASGSCMRG